MKHPLWFWPVYLVLGLASVQAEIAATNPAPPMTWLDRPDVLNFVFHPRREAANASPNPLYQALEIAVAPQVMVSGRAYTGAKTNATILFFHGNGEIVADYDQLGALYARSGINFIAVDYRGYGRSTGRPTTAALLADARTCFEFTRQWLAQRQLTGSLVVMGRSLGSAAALEIASAHPKQTAGLIIDSGFADTIGLLRRLGAPVPDSIQDNALHQTDKMRQYPGPVLILHGAEDRLIPVADAEVLYAAAPTKQKTLVKFERAGHNDIFALALGQYLQAIRQFVAALPAS